jgi:ribosome-binding factor A
MRSFRVDKLGSTIRDIVSDAIANRLNDPRISPLTSITRVEVSGDLQIAKVFVSVLGGASQARKTMAGLTHAGGHVQRLVAERLSVRRCPEIRFVLDASLKKAAETIRVIEDSVGQDRGQESQSPPGDESPDRSAANGAPE